MGIEVMLDLLLSVYFLVFFQNKLHLAVYKAAITMVLSQDVGLFPIIHGRKSLGNHSRGIH